MAGPSQALLVLLVVLPGLNARAADRFPGGNQGWNLVHTHSTDIYRHQRRVCNDPRAGRSRRCRSPRHPPDPDDTPVTDATDGYQRLPYSYSDSYSDSYSELRGGAGGSAPHAPAAAHEEPAAVGAGAASSFWRRCVAGCHLATHQRQGTATDDRAGLPTPTGAPERFLRAFWRRLRAETRLGWVGSRGGSETALLGPLRAACVPPADAPVHRCRQGRPQRGRPLAPRRGAPATRCRQGPRRRAASRPAAPRQAGVPNNCSEAFPHRAGARCVAGRNYAFLSIGPAVSASAGRPLAHRRDRTGLGVERRADASGRADMHLSRGPMRLRRRTLPHTHRRSGAFRPTPPLRPW